MNRHGKGKTEDAKRLGSKKSAGEVRPDAEVKPPKSEDDVLGVIEGVEQQLGALRNAHAEHRKAMADLAERRRKIEEQAEELEALETELGSREVELAEMRQEFEQRECDLVQRAQGLEQRESKIAMQAESLERKEAEIESEQAKVSSRLREIDEQLGGLRDQRAELESREAEANEKLAREEAAAAELVVVQKDLKTAEAKLRGREIELAERSKALEELAEQTGTLDAELSETKQELAEAVSSAQEHLAREQKVNEGLRAQLEQLADEGVAAHGLQEKVELLSAQLEEANAELAEMRASAKQSLSAEQSKVSELTEQIAGHRQEIAELNKQVEVSNAETKRLDSELKQAQAQLAKAPSSKAIEQANGVIQELREQIAEVGRIADEELTTERQKVAALDGQMKELGRQVEVLTQERDAVKKELATRADLGSEELKELQSRLTQTSTQLKKATEQLEQAGAKHQKLRAESAQQSKELEEASRTVEELAAKVKSLHAELEEERSIPKGVNVDEWNARRRERLNGIRLALKTNSEKIRRATDALRDRYDQCEQVLVKRAELAEAYEAIAAAQAKYTNREVRSGVFLGLSGIGFLVLVMAGISWFVAGRIAPGEYAARVTVVADAGDRVLSEDDLASWGAYMESLTTDPQFVEFAAERMKRRGLLTLGIPGKLSHEMRESLDVASSMPGSIEIEYRGEGSERSRRVLDTFAVALTSAANNARARRSDGATSRIVDEVTTGDQPLDTRRMEMAGMVFGGSMLSSLILGGLFWSRLSAAKARFERDSRIEPLLDDSQWQMPGS